MTNHRDEMPDDLNQPSDLDGLDDETLAYLALAEEMDAQAREQSDSGEPPKPSKPTPSKEFQNAFNRL